MTGSLGDPASPRAASYDPAASAILTVDLAALRDNYRSLRTRAGTAECAAVVKADAYGTGAERAVPALAAAGCRTFFVATLGEARTVRSVASEAVIYVLDGLLPDAAAGFAEIHARPVLGSVPEIEEWGAYCDSAGERLPAAIHVDTGMNRLGLRPEDVDALVSDSRLLDRFKPALVISHLACADDPGHSMNEIQRSSFEAARGRLPDLPACLANSGGIFLGPAYHFDMVRPGIALYGARAVNGVPNPMKQIVTLNARILQIRDAAPGESVGYGAARRLARSTRIATVAAGYADGIFRRLGAANGETGLSAWLGDHEAPIIGRVSMDTITVDVTDIPADRVARGAMVELIGQHNSVDDIADKAGTIGYEILTSLGARYQRVYIDHQEAAQ